MVRRAFVILVVIQGACTAGPDQPEMYRGPAFILNAHFADLPAAEILAAEMYVNAVNYCNTTGDTQSDLEEVAVEQREVYPYPFVTENIRVEFPAARSQLPLCTQGGNVGPLRFFRLQSWLEQSLPPGPHSPEGSYSLVGPWAPIGYDLVYASAATTFRPFGPAGPTVEFPRGYSWLRRTCGVTPGLIDMGVVSTSETVEFRLNRLPDYLPPGSLEIELSERHLVESCGATLPTEDLGSRISFDRAQSLVWSADGASLYYLPPADATDPTQSVGLRQVRLADSAASELTAIPLGRNLQIDVAGQLYVGGVDNLLRVVLAAGAPASLVAVPVPANAVLSPDGRWLAYYREPELHVWDIQSGADRTTVNGMFLAWSPDSGLAYWAWAAEPQTLNVLSPAALGEPKIHGPWDGSNRYVVWNTNGPLLALSPFDWAVESYDASADPASYVTVYSAGLSLQDPGTGAQRQVLDASAGEIDMVSTPPVLGFMLVWARDCLGLYNTVCSYSLLRVDLTDGTARTVAVGAREYPVAVSPDNQSIAIATPSGIYIKSLVQ